MNSAAEKREGAHSAPAVLRGVLDAWVDYGCGGGHRVHQSATSEPLFLDEVGRGVRAEARINEVRGKFTAWAFIDDAAGYTRPLVRAQEFTTLVDAKRACAAAVERIEPEPELCWTAQLDDDDDEIIAHVGELPGSCFYITLRCFDYEIADGSIDDHYEVELRRKNSDEVVERWTGRGPVSDGRALARRVILDAVFIQHQDAEGAL